MEQHDLARPYLLAGSLVALTACLALGVSRLSGSSLEGLLTMYPAVLASALYFDIGPAILGWLAANAMAAYLCRDPALFRGPLLAFCLSTALGAALAAHARRAAAMERSGLLQSTERARQELQRAAADKHAALAQLSHDLRSPLSTILGWTQVLRTQSPPEQMLHGLEAIERNARTQTRILEEIEDSPAAPASADSGRERG